VSVLRRLVREEHLKIGLAEQTLGSYLDLPLSRHAHTPFLAEILDLRRFSAYDAAYVVLAAHLRAPLLTTDAKLARAIVDARIDVTLT